MFTKTATEAQLVQRLTGTVRTYHRMLLWTLEYCRYQRDCLPLDTLPTFSLSGWDMKAIHVYLGKILRRLAESGEDGPRCDLPPYDYWSQAISRFTFKGKDETVKWGVVGTSIHADAHIVRVEFVRNPALLPFGNVLDSFWYLGRRLGYDCKKLFCYFKGIRLEDAASVMGLAMHQVDSPRELTLTVRAWRDQVDGCLEAMPEFQTDKENSCPSR